MTKIKYTLRGATGTPDKECICCVLPRIGENIIFQDGTDYTVRSVWHCPDTGEIIVNAW